MKKYLKSVVALVASLSLIPAYVSVYAAEKNDDVRISVGYNQEMVFFEEGFENGSKKVDTSRVKPDDAEGAYTQLADITSAQCVTEDDNTALKIVSEDSKTTWTSVGFGEIKTAPLALGAKSNLFTVNYKIKFGSAIKGETLTNSQGVVSDFRTTGSELAFAWLYTDSKTRKHSASEYAYSLNDENNIQLGNVVLNSDWNEISHIFDNINKKEIIRVNGVFACEREMLSEYNAFYQMSFVPVGTCEMYIDDIEVTSYEGEVGFGETNADLETGNGAKTMVSAPDAQNVKLYIDGEYECDMARVDSSDIFTAELTDEFGSTEISAAAFYADGSVASAEKNVNIKKVSHNALPDTDSKTLSDFNDMPSGFSGGDSDTNSIAFQSAYGWRPSGHVAVERITGPSGQKTDYAPKFTPSGNDPNMSLLLAGQTKNSNTFHGKQKTLPKTGKLVYDFDLMLTGSSAYIQLQGVPLWTESLYIIDSGKIAGTSSKLPVNQWVHLKLVYDMTEGSDAGVGKWYVWADEALIIDGINSVAYGSTTYFKAVTIKAGINSGTPSYGFAIDNLTVYNAQLNMYNEGVSYITDNNETIANDTVPSDASAIMLTMSRVITAETCPVRLSIDGTRVSVNTQYSENIITIPLSGLAAGSKLDIILNDTIGKTLYVTEPDGTYLKVTDETIENSAYTAVYHTAGNITPLIVGAVYDGNKLSAVKVCDAIVSAEGDHNMWVIKLPVTAETTEVKVLTWESAGTVKPIKTDVGFQITQ